MPLHPTAVQEETGFSAVEMLLYLVIAALIAFVGIYVFNSQKSADANYNAASQAAQTSPPKVPKKAATKTLQAP